MVKWTLTRDGTTVESALYDVELLDSANTFGDELIAKIDDVDGEKFDAYRRGTRVDVSVAPETADENISVNTTDTFTVASGEIETSGTVYNAGTFQNGGVTNVSKNGPTQKFSGFVVEPREIEQGGADALEITAYTFDQFLRRNKVSTDLTGETIADALELIITNDTPITFNASNIEVGDEQELTRSYRGDPVEQTLQDLAFKSNDENFGVNDDLEFFFRPRETKHIDRGIDDTQWFNTDIPERGKEAINEVEVWYSDGNQSVIVDDGGDKLDLQNSLGLEDPGKQKAEITREELTDISDAEDEGRKYLNFRNNTLSGQITTFGLFDAEPGDTIDVTISTQGIDTEFQIAEVEYRWGTDETILTVVEKRGDNDDVLLRLTEAVSRVEMRPSDRDAPKNRITTTNARAIVNSETRVNARLSQDATRVSSGETTVVGATETIEAEAWENAGTITNAGTVTEPGDEVAEQIVDRDRWTNMGRNLLRDVWAGEAIDPIGTLVIGDDASGLSRSNTELRNQTDSVSVTANLIGDKSVSYSADVPTTVQEIGLKTQSGNLVYRAVDANGIELLDITITLTIADDVSVTRGVVTNTGQKAARDTLAGNSPTLPPDEYGYGSGTTDPNEANTSLENEVIRQGLDEVLIQNADTQSQWESITPDFAEDRPVSVQNGELKTTNISATTEGENFDSGQTGFSDVSDTNDYSNTNFWAGSRDPSVSGTADFAEWEFSFAHRVPTPEVRISVLDAGNSNGEAPAFEWYIIDPDGNQTLIEELNTFGVGISSGSTPTWNELTRTNPYDGPATYNGPAFEAGETYTLRVEITDSDGSADLYNYHVDAVAPYDARYESQIQFDTVTDGSRIAGPELVPELESVSLNTAITRRNVSEARFDSTWNDVSNSQYVELANDGSTFTRINNSETGTVNFASLEASVDTTLGISRFSSGSNITPSEGNTAQAVDIWELYANVDAISTDGIGDVLTRAIVPPDTITGETLSEGGLFANGDLLTHSVFAEFDVLQDQRIASAESTRFTGEE